MILAHIETRLNSTFATAVERTRSEEFAKIYVRILPLHNIRRKTTIRLKIYPPETEEAMVRVHYPHVGTHHREARTELLEGFESTYDA